MIGAIENANGLLFCGHPVVRFPLGNGREFVYALTRHTVQVLGSADSGALAACSRLKRLSEHIEHLPQHLLALGVDLPQALEALARAGMVMSTEDLLARAESFSETGPPGIVSWLAIPTAGWPESCRQALESYQAHFQRFGRSLKVLISNDSRSAEQSRNLKEFLRPAVESSAQAVFYLGSEERRQFSALLAGSGDLPPSVVQFGLSGPGGDAPTFGANRNTVLLATAGEMVLSVDDDTRCWPCVPDDADNPDGTLRFGDDGDPSEFWFHPDRDSALASLRALNMDPVAGHEALLGKPIWSLFKSAMANGSLDAQPACAHLLASVWSGRGRVLLTVNGSAGDSGMFSSSGLPLHQRPATRRRLVASGEAYASALSSREIVRQAQVATVCHGGPMMSMFAGFDNRTLLPPFFPAFRNEDGSFGAVLSRCHDDCYAAYLPWSMLHVPPERRAYSQQTRNPVRISELIILCCATWARACRGMEAAANIRSLGRHLIDIASVPSGEFHEAMRFLLLRRAAERVSRGVFLLQQYGGQPRFWAEDVSRHIEEYERAVTRPDCELPIDFPGPITPTEAWLNVRDLIRRYGELLVWWPAIVERARQLAVAEQLPLSKIT